MLDIIIALVIINNLLEITNWILIFNSFLNFTILFQSLVKHFKQPEVYTCIFKLEIKTKKVNAKKFNLINKNKTDQIL